MQWVGQKGAPQREATAAEGAEVKQTSPRCCPGWGCGATRAGARHQLVSDPLNQSAELTIECGVDKSKGQREVVRTERATSRGPEGPNEPLSGTRVSKDHVIRKRRALAAQSGSLQTRVKKSC